MKLFKLNLEPIDTPQKADIDFEDPAAILAKGWGMFTNLATQGARAAIVAGEAVGKTVNENVLNN